MAEHLAGFFVAEYVAVVWPGNGGKSFAFGAYGFIRYTQHDAVFAPVVTVCVLAVVSEGQCVRYFVQERFVDELRVFLHEVQHKISGKGDAVTRKVAAPEAAFGSIPPETPAAQTNGLDDGEGVMVQSLVRKRLGEGW